jgi:hypothetical protein
MTSVLMENLMENKREFDFKDQLVPIHRKPLRRSIDSAISIRSIPNDPKIQIVQAEKSIFPTPAFVQVLTQHQDHYVTLQEQEQANPAQSTNWTPLTIWNPSTRSWNVPPNVPQTYSSPIKMTRRSYVHCVLFGLLICIGLSLGLVISLHFGHDDIPFDPTNGPRGSAPSVYEGPSLPVLLDLHNSSTGVYFGAGLDWSIDDPEHFNLDVGVSASIQDVVFFMNQTFTTGGSVNSSGYLHQVDDVFSWTAALIRGTGAIMSITVIPTIPLTQVNQTGLHLLATKCKDVNEMGIPVLLRFAPDMNGNWHPYGQDPIRYRTKFREMVFAVRNATNNTAIVWSPVSALGYPFTPTQYTPQKSDARFLELDTSGNGVLDSQDDPFSPYYPGDSFVDWVGLSVFYTSGYPIHPVTYQRPSRALIDLPIPSSSTAPTSTVATETFSATHTTTPNWKYEMIINRAPPPSSLEFQSTSFEAQLLTSGTIFNFYRDFVESRKKPFIVSDSSAGYFKGLNVISTVDEEVFKLRWFGQILNSDLLKKYPLIRGLVFYNNILTLQETTFIDRFDPFTLVDYSFTKNRSVLASFQTLLTNPNLTSIIKFSNVTTQTQQVFLTEV